MSVRIYVPLDSTAVALGADETALAIVREAQRRGIEVEIVRNGSRGLFWLEPLVEVVTSTGRIGYGPVKDHDVASLFEADFIDGGIHQLRQGLTEDIDLLKRQQRLTFARCGIVDPLSLSDYERHGGWVGLARALKMNPGAIVEEVVASGLRGRGGAGFPTGMKWRTVLGAQAEQKYIVCNADEGDSGTFADRMLMEGDPFTLIEGMTIAGLATGATKGFIYIRSEYPHAFRTVENAIEVARRAGLIGADICRSGRTFDIEARLGAGAYICGEETSLLESLEGKRGQVRAKPPLPAISGLFGKPTVINNVLSLATIPWVLANGADAYASYGTGRSRGTQPFQLGGNVSRAGLYEFALGLTIRELVEKIGAGTKTGRPIRAVQVGGPLGAYFPQSMFDTQLDYESMLAAKGMLGHGGVVVFDDTVDLANQARFAMEFCAIESCGKCTPCRIGSTRGRETVERIIAGTEREQNLQLLEELCALMADGSLCALGGLTPIPVMSATTHFPEDFHRAPALTAE